MYSQEVCQYLVFIILVYQRHLVLFKVESLFGCVHLHNLVYIIFVGIYKNIISFPNSLEFRVGLEYSIQASAHIAPVFDARIYVSIVGVLHTMQSFQLFFFRFSETFCFIYARFYACILISL